MVGVELDRVVDGDVGPVAVDVVESARRHADRGGDLGVAAPQRVPAVRADQLGALDAQVRLGDGRDAARDDPQPDGAARGVLRSGEQQLGDTVQGEAGAGEVHGRFLRSFEIGPL